MTSTILVNSNPTTLTVQLFTDRVLITITQLPAFGTILTSSITTSQASSKDTYNINILLGRRDDDIIPIFVRQIMEKASIFDGGLKEGRNAIFMIGLKEEGKGREAFVEISNEVLRVYHELMLKY
ncbi:hypothetical protein TrLO_g3025 [Triparma laevis f. longispina]|uniref:Proteasome assembly chaperone 3 n=1 Tax=Triparma laevis f. longispina TaxID=1714387 RepID=A0A9W7E9J7_9STRA|nr:hypothetical protein TrLO_g3025 [Triparma laevis f. longispina]